MIQFMQMLIHGMSNLDTPYVGNLVKLHSNDMVVDLSKMHAMSKHIVKDACWAKSISFPS